MDDRSERAAVAIAERKVTEIESALEAARVEVRTAEAVLSSAETLLEQVELSLADQEALRQRGSAAFQQNQFERAENQREARSFDVQAARSRLEGTRLRVSSVLPAQLESARAALEQAQVELAKTQIFAAADGTVEQVTLTVGARASQLALNPSLVIVPDRPEDEPAFVSAGFAQVTRGVLHEGMAAEVACESNFNIAMRETILPARIVRIQDVVAAGQITPTGRLLEPAALAQRGEIVAHLELVHPEHQPRLIDGSGCMVQAYTTHITGALEGGIIAHGIEALGVLKAVLLRVKVWVALAAGIGLAGGGAH